MYQRVLLFSLFIFSLLNGMCQHSNSFYGVYKLENGKHISIAPFGTGIAMFQEDGRVAGLSAEGDQLNIGKTLGNINDVVGKISFTTSGDKRVIHLRYTDGSVANGIKVLLTERKMNFKNGSQKLAGELILPEGNGPFAVIVQTHGSGEETRESSRGMAYLFASYGIASFIFDKRGCGESSGKEWRASFKDYAKDLLAAVECVSILSEIDPKKIGIFGHSQGGWVVPLAYSLRPEKISFCIMSAANAESPVEENLYAGDEEFRLRGLDETAINEAHQFRKIKYEVGILGKGLDEYKSNILPVAEKKSWFRLTGSGLPDNIFWKENGFYDATPALQSIQCPVLLLYAGHDISTDSKTQIPLMKKLIPSKNVSFSLFENANHMMMKVLNKDFTSKQLPGITQMADGYIEALIGWVNKIIK